MLSRIGFKVQGQELTARYKALALEFQNILKEGEITAQSLPKQADLAPFVNKRALPNLIQIMNERHSLSMSFTTLRRTKAKIS